MDEPQNVVTDQQPPPQTQSVPPAPPIQPQMLSDQERKQVKLAQMATTTRGAFIMISRGLGKIVEELSSLLLKR